MNKHFLPPVSSQSVEVICDPEKLREVSATKQSSVFKQRCDARASILQKFKEQQKLYELTQKASCNEQSPVNLQGQRNNPTTNNPDRSMMDWFLAAIGNLNRNQGQPNQGDIYDFNFESDTLEQYYEAIGDEIADLNDDSDGSNYS